MSGAQHVAARGNCQPACCESRCCGSTRIRSGTSASLPTARGSRRRARTAPSYSGTCVPSFTHRRTCIKFVRRPRIRCLPLAARVYALSTVVPAPPVRTFAPNKLPWPSYLGCSKWLFLSVKFQRFKKTPGFAAGFAAPGEGGWRGCRVSSLRSPCKVAPCASRCHAADRDQIVRTCARDTQPYAGERSYAQVDRSARTLHRRCVVTAGATIETFAWRPDSGAVAVLLARDAAQSPLRARDAAGVRIWSIDGAELEGAPQTGAGGKATSVAWTPDGQFLLTCHPNQHIVRSSARHAALAADGAGPDPLKKGRGWGSVRRR